MDVARLHQRPQAGLVDVALADEAGAVEAEPLQPAVEVEAGRDGADEQQARARLVAPQPGERLEQLRHALARVDVAERAEERAAGDVGGRRVGHGEGGMRDDPDGPVVAGRSRPVAHVGRVHDQPGGEVEHLAGEVEVLGAVLPERRDALVEHGVAEQPADDAALALHRVEVAVAVAAADREAGDEVVEDEVVQHDDAGRAPQRVDDPAVGVRVVADVVDAEVGAARRLLAAAAGDDDVAPRLQRRQEERGVVGDARALGRHRAEERDLHERSLPIARSQVTCAAIALPARP